MTKEQKEQQKIIEVQTAFKNNVIQAASIYPFLIKKKQITESQRDDLFNKINFLDAFITDHDQDYALMQSILQTIADYAFFSMPNTSRKKTDMDYELDEIKSFLDTLKNMNKWLNGAGRPMSETIPQAIKDLQTFFSGVADEYKIPTIAQAGKNFVDTLFDLLVSAPQNRQNTISNTDLLKEIQALKVTIRTLHNPTFKKIRKKAKSK